MGVILEHTVIEEMSAAANRSERTGQSYPLGATILPDGVNFSVFSRGASAVELLLFNREDDARPTRVIPVDPAANRAVGVLLALPAVAAGRLLLVAAQSSAELVVSLERQDADARWRVAGFERGRSPVIAVPSDGDTTRPWRASVWAIDGGAAPITVAARAVVVGFCKRYNLLHLTFQSSLNRFRLALPSSDPVFASLPVPCSKKMP